LVDIELRIGQWPEGLGQIRSAVQAVSEQRRLGDEVREALVLALEEVVANVFDHGASDEVSLRIVCDNREIAAEVVDSGPAFDPWPSPIRTPIPGSTSAPWAGSVSFWSRN